MPLNSDSEVSNGDVHVLHYNVNWMSSAFKSRAAAEALLSPELESGNLSYRDYDTAIQFLPGPHRYYHVRSLAQSLAFSEISLRIAFLCALGDWACCWYCLRPRASVPIPPYEPTEAVFSLTRHNFNGSNCWKGVPNICTSRLPA